MRRSLVPAHGVRNSPCLRPGSVVVRDFGYSLTSLPSGFISRKPYHCSRYDYVAERRRHPRTQYVSRTEVTWSSDTNEVKIPGMIEDRSVSGLGIQAGKPIPVGTRATVLFRNQMVKVEVRRCVKVNPGFLIGVSFVGDEAK
ncbi:MAG: PilZ domain-containing protein [Bryobacteraceae bacterium]